MPAQADRIESIRKHLRSRRMQERFFHLRFYEGEAPAQSLLTGIELTEAARQMGRSAD